MLPMSLAAGTGTTIQAVKDIPGRLLVEQIQHVQFDLQALVSGESKIVADQHVCSREGWRAAHVARPSTIEPIPPLVFWLITYVVIGVPLPP